ncbi:extensin family protein [Croceicoccus sp. YJ47]|uniref:extensin family protein n=1 Tax=Croceicoccus sp. YJ47 TaxID=2798724 RepID=UPI001F2BF41D|nr:extensin family protein [Croceicoccus sp. YJ47]
MSNRVPPMKFRRLPCISVAMALLLSACAGDAPAPSRDTRGTGTASGAQGDANVRQCRALLGDAGVAFTPAQDLFAGKGCDSTNAVYLQSLPSDDLRMSLSNLDRVYCPLADSFAGWARYGVNRAAEQIMGSPVTKIETFGSYSCRNVAGTGRRSAHSNAQAIDISAFVLADGRRVTVLDGWNGSRAEREFLRAVHQSACKRFGTTLGPDYNAAHRNHFHVEPGGGGFCR